MLHVGGEPSGRVRETVTLKIKEAEATGPGAKCEFQLKIPGSTFVVILAIPYLCWSLLISDVRAHMYVYMYIYMYIM